MLAFLLFPWGFLTPALVGGGAFFEYRGLSYVLILVMLLVFLFENAAFKTKRTGVYLPVFFLASGVFLSVFKHSNVASTAEFAIYLCCAVGLGFLANFFAFEQREKNTVLNFLTLLISLLALYGLFQYFFVYPALEKESMDLSSFFEKRLTSVLTSPAAYASIVVISWPLVFYLFANEKNRRKRLFYGISLFLLLASLGLTASKSGFAAMFIQALLIIGFSMRYLKDNRKTVFKSALFFLLLALALGLTSLFVTRLGIPYALSNLKVSLEGRVSLWISALKMFAENPLTGIGAGCFKDAIFKYQHDGFYSTNAHSSFIQLFAETGILGGLGFVLIGIYLFLQCCLFNRAFNLSKSIAAGLVGFLFMNLFDSIVYYHLPGYLFAIFAGLSFAEIEKPSSMNRDFPRSAFIFFFVLLLVLSILINVAHYLYLNGRSLLITDYEQGLKLLRIATVLNPVEGSYHQALAQAYSVGAPTVRSYRYLRIMELKKAIFLEPLNSRFLFELGYIYETEGQVELAAYFYKKASSLSPRQPFYYYQLARLYYNNLKFDQAKKYANLCLSQEFYYQKRYVFQSYRTGKSVSEFDPFLSMARAALILGDLSIHSRDFKSSIGYYEKAAHLYPSLPEAYGSKAYALIRLNSYREAEENARKAIEMDPENPNYYYYAALANYYLGDYSESYNLISEALKIEPQNPVFLNFLEKVRKVN